ncbi:hypothetical protein B296_00012327 [Ensete ventricosum]|uniref:Phytocyanin domain-containing protein n=1 Tax=Ensete ventricosum TaxID=4639 RepID=A0A426ZQA7_ENSVE|nr:hypothetical protein B296_00012327 [Ensete ventricosum]
MDEPKYLAVAIGSAHEAYPTLKSEAVVGARAAGDRRRSRTYDSLGPSELVSSSPRSCHSLRSILCRATPYSSSSSPTVLDAVLWAPPFPASGPFVMAQGRGSAAAGGQAAVALGLAVLCLLLAHVQMVEAATYTVGDSGGWSFNMARWSRGKRFRAGDVLGECRPASVFTSGNDRVTLARGRNFFICNFAGHCQSGMKIAIVAA